MYGEKLSGELRLTTQDGYMLGPVRLEIPISQAVDQHLQMMKKSYEIAKLEYEQRIARLEKELAEANEKLNKNGRRK